MQNNSFDSGGAKKGFLQQEWAHRNWFTHLFTTQGVHDPGAYFAHGMNGYQAFRHERLLLYLQNLQESIEHDIMLDLGCGTGILTAKIFRDLGFKNAIGLDFVPEVVAEATRVFPEIEFQTCALPHLPFPSETFNLVVASEVLYYLTEEGRNASVEEIRRVLKPHGVLLFSSVLGDRYFTPESALALVSSKLTIVKYRFDYQKLFHFVTTPFYLAKRLQKYLDAGEIPGTRHSVNRVKKVEGVFRLSIFRILLHSLCKFGDGILASVFLPKIFQYASAGLCPWFTRNNIIIVARKDQEDFHCVNSDSHS